MEAESRADDKPPAPPARTRWRWIAGAAAIVIVVGIVYQSVSFLSQPKQRRGRFLDAGLQPVGVARVRRGDIRVIDHALGAVTPLATVTVHTQISGQLLEVGFREGQLVHKGQFLAAVDPRPYQVALEQDEAQLARDTATLRQAEMDLARYQTLSQQVSIPRQTAEDQVWIVKQDQGTVDYDKAQIRAQQLNLAYCRIVAPTDGRVGLRLVDPGNLVQPSDATGIVVITRLDPISVEFSVPEDAVPPILARVRAGAALPVVAFDRANVTQLATGQLTAIDNQVDATTGTVKLRASFDNGDERLFPNQFVNVTVLLDTLRDVLTVPIAAVQRGAPGTYVYLVNPDDTVGVHPIRLGAQDGELFEVASGLSVGDRVVTDGADRLRDGAHVTIPASGVGPAAGADAGKGDAEAADRHERRRRHRPQGAEPPATEPQGYPRPRSEPTDNRP